MLASDLLEKELYLKLDSRKAKTKISESGFALYSRLNESF